MRYHVPFAEMNFQDCALGVKHKVHDRDGLRLRLVEYRATMPPHWCERGHLGQILEGRMLIEFESGSQLYEAGDGVDIPEGAQHRHQARVLTDRVLAIFVERAG